MADAVIMPMIEYISLAIAGHGKGQIKIIGPAVQPFGCSLQHISLGILPICTNTCFRTSGIVDQQRLQIGQTCIPAMPLAVQRTHFTGNQLAGRSAVIQEQTPAFPPQRCPIGQVPGLQSLGSRITQRQTITPSRQTAPRIIKPFPPVTS